MLEASVILPIFFSKKKYIIYFDITNKCNKTDLPSSIFNPYWKILHLASSHTTLSVIPKNAIHTL